MVGSDCLKIALASQHFYPDDFRVNEIASALVSQGHSVTVFTSLPDYKTGRVPKEYKGFKKRNDEYKGVKIKRCFSVSRRSGVIFRALNYLSFFISSTVKMYFSKEKFDISICYQTSPVLMANGARALAKRQKIPFLIYSLDLWPECLKAWNVGENSVLYKIMHKYCINIYNSADLIAVSSKPFIEYHSKVNNVPLNKMLYLPQHSKDMNLPLKKAKGSDEPVVFAFGGNIGSVQNVECIVRAVNELSKDLNFRVEIYGNGSELENCKELAEKLNVTDKIMFFGRVDRDTLWKKYENADAFLLTLKPQGYISMTVPAKLQEYMSGNRPIIASADYADRIINEAGCGVCVQGDDFKALAEKMKQFIENKEDFSVLAENGRKYFTSNFTLDIFIKRLNEILNKLVL